MFLLSFTGIRQHAACPDQWVWAIHYADGVAIDGYTGSDGKARDIMLHTPYVTVTVDPFYIHVKEN